MNAATLLKSGRTHHHVKSVPEAFEPALTGRKTFEIRIFDRAYSTGDLVTLHEWNPVEGLAGHVPELAPGYTNRAITFLIGYVERSAVVPAGWCGFELIPVEVALRVGAAVCR